MDLAHLADWDTYLQAAREWEEPGERTRRVLREVNANGSPEETLEAALSALRGRGLA